MTDTTKPAPGTPEYDAAMIAKAETGGVTATHTDANGSETRVDVPPPPAADAPEGEKPSEPELILGKFKSIEDLQKAYTELEKKLGQPKEEPKAEQPGDQPVPEASLQALGEQASRELSESGALTDATYEAYSKAGISREQIDAYLEGVKAVGQLRVIEAHREVGGEESYKAMTSWAETAMSQAEKDAFNHAVFGNDDGARLNAIRGLKARYEAENGQRGSLVRPRASAEALSGEVFRSRTEMVKAMQDVRYKTDPAYRSDVERRVLNSTNAGIDLF